MGNRFLVPSVVPGGMTLLSTTTLSGASVTLSSIPAIYKDLRILVRNYLPATDDQSIQIRINADATANRHGATTAYGTSAAATFTTTEVNINGGNDNSVANGIVICNIYDYANSTTWKMWDYISLDVNATTTTNANVYRAHGRYNQTTAISSLLFKPQSGNFTSGTLLLYGVN